MCSQPCESNNRLIDRNFREKAQDIFVLQISIDKRANVAVCDSCQSQVERFYLFKGKCRQQEELRKNPKATALSTGFAVEDLKVKLPPVKVEPTSDPDIPEEPLGEIVEEPALPPKRKQKYVKLTNHVRERFTKEQLATRTRKELYKERYQKICELCGKTMLQKYMEGHMNMHRDVRPYVCEVLGCVAQFHSLEALKGHMRRSHSGEHHVCPECGKVCTSIQTLRNHRRSHDEKQHSCEICHLKIRLKSVLKRHMLIHTQQRDHKCEYCGKAFYAKTVLTLHLRSHTGERPYVCHVCGVANAHRILYVKHMQKFHPAEEIRTLAEMQRLTKAEGKD